MPASRLVSGSSFSPSQSLSTRRLSSPTANITSASKMSPGRIFRPPSGLSLRPIWVKPSSNSPGLEPDGKNASKIAVASSRVRPIPASSVLAWAW